MASPRQMASPMRRPSLKPHSPGSSSNNVMDHIPTQLGSIVLSNKNTNGNRRLSTFSNLPVETRLGDNVSIEELMNTIEGRQENSFRLEPTKGVSNTQQLSVFVKDLINRELADFSGNYSSFTAKYYVKILAETVKQEIKDRVDKRYKVIVSTSIGENNGQDLRMKSTFLWDAVRDRYFDVNIVVSDKDPGIFIVTKVFLIYYD